MAGAGLATIPESSTRTERRSLWRLLPRAVGIVGLWVLVLGLIAWASAALYFDLSPRRVGEIAAMLYATVMLLAWILVRKRTRAVLAPLGGFFIVLAWWWSLDPSNQRDWLPEVAVLSTATVLGDRVTIRNIRNFEYRTETNFTPRYYDKTLDLRELDSVDLIAVHWGSPAIAHVMVSFGFANGRDHVCFSIETRKERGEGYSTLKGFFRQFELFYVVADERDVIGVRANHRKPEEEVYVFRTRLPRENQRKLFLDYLGRINELARQPAWYNTLTENCTTSAFLHTRAYQRRARYNWKLLLSGYTAQYAAELGTLDSSIPFAELRQRARVNDRARDDKADDFSRRIRRDMPLPKPMTLDEFLHPP